MIDDSHELKRSLRMYLIASGYDFKRVDGAERCKCPNPSHLDKNPSAVLYENNNNPPVDILACQSVCQKSWNVFAIASFITGIPDTTENYPKLADEIRNKIGKSAPETRKSIPEKITELTKPTLYDTLDDAKKILNLEKFHSIAQKIGVDGKILAVYPYRNADGKWFLFDVKFKGEKGNTTISFYHNGKYVTSKKPPHAILYIEDFYANPEKPVLIVEGGAAATAGKENLKNFTVLTWRGGTGFSDKQDWSFLNDSQVYILPDDDRKKYGENHIKSGQLLPIQDQPGMKSAIKIKNKIPHAKIMIPPQEARKIREDGADIVEILQVMKSDEIEKMILSGPYFGENKKQDNGNGYEDLIPFKILGTDENGISHFIVRGGHLQSYATDTLTKGKLLKLADLNFWESSYPVGKNGVNWDQAIDDIIEIALNKDFRIDDVCGIGAWISKDGKICYNDGKNVYGEKDQSKLYVKKIRFDIGINEYPADPKMMEEIKEEIFKLSFENQADAIKALAWATIAPFGGALEWRPMLMLTGESGSGKTTVANLIIKPIAIPLYLDATITTEPGVRSKLKRDSIPAFFEEAEGKTNSQGYNDRNDLFAIARISANNDGPEGLKGTKEGGYVSYKRNNMFGFCGINPVIENTADRNRMVWIEMKKPVRKNAKDYQRLEANIKRLLSEKNCRRIRARAWNNIGKIMKMIPSVAVEIQEQTGMGYRDCLREGVLVACYLRVWRDIYDVENQESKDIINKYFDMAKTENERDESEELLIKLFDGKTFPIFSDGNQREDLTIREMLDVMHSPLDATNRTSCQKMLARLGIRYFPEGYKDNKGIEYPQHRVAIANNHPMVMDIIKKGNGYHKYFHRLPECLEIEDRDRMVRMGSESKRSTILTGILEKNVEKTKIGVLNFSDI